MTGPIRCTPPAARRRGRAGRRLALALLAALVAGACGTDASPVARDSGPDPTAADPGPDPTAVDPGPNPTAADPGPNPTVVDPGPNDTSAGPTTVQGTLRLGAASGCVTLETDGGPLALRLADAGVAYDEEQRRLEDDAGRAFARDGDSLIVTGWPGSATRRCGAVFAVDSVNSVQRPG